MWCRPARAGYSALPCRVSGGSQALLHAGNCHAVDLLFELNMGRYRCQPGVGGGDGVIVAGPVVVVFGGAAVEDCAIADDVIGDDDGSRM